MPIKPGQIYKFNGKTFMARLIPSMIILACNRKHVFHMELEGKYVSPAHLSTKVFKVWYDLVTDIFCDD